MKQNINNNIKLLPVSQTLSDEANYSVMRPMRVVALKGERKDEDTAQRRPSDESAAGGLPPNIFKYRHAFFHQTNGSNSFTFREYDIKSGAGAANKQKSKETKSLQESSKP